ncbi:MAG: phosphatase PAP2 family protein [Treponema sp.]|nr:phosphatase PAP2 family protein [Treponema sp.]
MSKKKFFYLSVLFIFAVSLVLFETSLKNRRAITEWNGEPYSIENVNALDARFAQPYDETLDNLGDVFVIMTNFIALLPLAFVFFRSKEKKAAFLQGLYEFFTYCLCFVYVSAIYRILKMLVGRIRPYMYFAEPSAEGIAEGDFCMSWPSGHSATILVAFAFALGWFVFRHPGAKCKKPMLCIVALLCAATMLLRMLSGNHFLTDVLSGAALGFAVSIAVFTICNRIVPASGQFQK